MLHFEELTIGDAYNFGIICPIDQESGLSVRQFIQPDICCLFINNQPVVIIFDFSIPIRKTIYVRTKKQAIHVKHTHLEISLHLFVIHFVAIPYIGGCL